TTSLDVSPSGGNGTATFTSVQCSDAGLNKQMTASAYGLTDAVSTNFFVGGVERATGGTAISSGSAGGAYTNLTGPAYYEVTIGEAGAGTIILSVPSGFVFDTGGPAPTVLLTELGHGNHANHNI